jgi:hypothetical protein
MASALVTSAYGVQDIWLRAELQTHKNIINLRWVASRSNHYCLATAHRHLYINQLIYRPVELKLYLYLITKPINLKDIQSNKNVITFLLEFSTMYHLSQPNSWVFTFLILLHSTTCFGLQAANTPTSTVYSQQWNIDEQCDARKRHQRSVIIVCTFNTNIF